jgi:hypothetical protein
MKLVGVGCVLMTAGVPSAWADAIDGHWCYPDGRRIFIQGSAIITPGGNRIDGNYSRHFYSYVAPSSEPDSGQTVFMALMNEETVRLRVGAAPAYPSDASEQVWHRCGPPTS